MWAKSVPGHDIRADEEAVALEWESTDGTPLRAVFSARSDKIYLDGVETRTRPPHPIEEAWAAVPDALAEQLELRGWELPDRPDEDDEDETEEVTAGAGR